MTELKEKFKDCELISAMHICLSDPAITETIARIGFDFLWIETEHSPMDYQGVLMNLIAATAGGTPCIVRIPWNDGVLAKRILEMGPTGIIFPMVSTKEECDAAIAATLYPPKGTRGFGPQRAIGYGLEDGGAYVKEKSFELIRIVQVETVDCIEHELDAMLENEWIDCVMLGPCDLSASIGLLPDISAKEAVALQDRALNKIRKAGKSAGTSIGTNDPRVIKSWYDRGANVISCNTEMAYIISGARKTLSMIKGETYRPVSCGAI